MRPSAVPHRLRHRLHLHRFLRFRIRDRDLQSQQNNTHAPRQPSLADLGHPLCSWHTAARAGAYASGSKDGLGMACQRHDGVDGQMEE